MAKVRLPPKPPTPLRLKVLRVVEEDLDALGNEKVRNAFLATVEQLQNDENYLERLLQDHYGEMHGDRFREPIGVRQVVEVGVKKDREIWRFKIWRLDNAGLRFRFFYGYFPAARLLVVLGVDGRDGNTYDIDGELVRRVCSDYERLSQRYD